MTPQTHQSSLDRIRLTTPQIVAAVFALHAAGVVCMATQTVVIQGAADTVDATLSAWNDTTNYGSSQSYELRNYQSASSSWAVIKFDLPDLDPGQFISDAAMTFDYFANYDSTPGDMVVDLNRPLYSWTESGVTWRDRTTSWTWGGPSGQEHIDARYTGTDNPVNYASASLAQVTLTAGEFGLKTFQSNQLTSTLNDMARGALPDHGFLLNPGRSGGVNNRFYLVSSERTSGTLPKLTLTVSEQKSFPIGWYDGSDDDSTPGKIASEGGNFTIAYKTASWNDMEDYLDAADDAGVKVILELDSYQVSNENGAWISNYVDTFDDHPALYGWYLADEPELYVITPEQAEYAYDTIKSGSSKPVFMTFSMSGLEDDSALDYADAYDVFMFDKYPFLASNSTEYSGLADPDAETNGWMSLVELASTQAQQVGKSWWSIPQGFGEQPGETWDKRLPSLNEARFQAYWSILNEAEGIITWAHYRAESTTANTSGPYNDDGEAWLDDVSRPLAAEFAQHGNALLAGALSNVVTDNRASILCEVYYDASTGEYFLLAVNSSATGTTPTFTLANLPTMTTAVYIGEAGGDITITDDTFYDSFSGYAVHVYQLIPDYGMIPEPSFASLVLVGFVLMGKRPTGK